MNWVKFRLWSYAPLMLAGVAASVVAIILLRGQPLVLLTLGIVLLLPGQIARMLLVDLIKSRKQLALGDFEGSLNSSQRFLEACHRRPWIRHAMWALYGIYSLDVVAMGLNNAGAALLDLNRLDQSESFLKASMEKDPHNPLPVMNLARLEGRRGNGAHAIELAARANDLGFPIRDLEEIERILARKRAR